MSLKVIEPRTQARDAVNQRRYQAHQPDVITGAQFRRKLGWGKDRFRAAVQSGRFTHLIAVNASSRTRVVYVRAKVDAWLTETPAVNLRPSGHNRVSA